jgi:predicted  nucleic acid-binding Zn-ribbon protein
MPGDARNGWSVRGDLQNLITLQEVDFRLQDLVAQKQRVPELIEAARRSFQSSQAHRDSLTKDFDRAVKERKAREQELTAQEQAIGKMEDRAVKGEIKTNKEYHAHLFEIDLAKKKKGEIEEALLLLMDEVDLKKKLLAQAEEAVKAGERKFETEKASLEGSIGRLEAEFMELTQKRKDISAAVEPLLLKKYEKLRGNKKGQALAGVNKEASCMACRLQIEPQVVSDVKRADAILTCSYCHRILYWAGEPPQPVAEPERLLEEVEQTGGGDHRLT